MNNQIYFLFAGMTIFAAFSMDKSIEIINSSPPANTVSLEPSSSSSSNSGRSSSGPTSGRVISGRAVITDGDTLRIGNTRVRFNGIAAPERNDRGGQASTANLRRLINGAKVECQLTGAKSYKRFIGTCYVNNRDLSKQQVASGHALDCARYSGGRYAAAENSAIGKGRNLGNIYKRPSYCRR